MIDFHYWPTPNGWKVAIMLEECDLDYSMIPVNIRHGDQHAPAFLAISPNGRMPAIADHDAPGGPLSVFESAAILLHLTDRTGRFAPTNSPGRTALMEWLFWQIANLGPMAGQLSHFVNYAQGKHPYYKGRYAAEYRRCLGVLERRLDRRDFILGEYSIADMAAWPRGADRQSVRAVAGRTAERVALARRGEAAPGGAARGGLGQGVAPVRAAER